MKPQETIDLLVEDLKSSTAAEITPEKMKRKKKAQKAKEAAKVKSLKGSSRGGSLSSRKGGSLSRGATAAAAMKVEQRSKGSLLE